MDQVGRQKEAGGQWAEWSGRVGRVGSGQWAVGMSREKINPVYGLFHYLLLFRV